MRDDDASPPSPGGRRFGEGLLRLLGAKDTRLIDVPGIARRNFRLIQSVLHRERIRDAAVDDAEQTVLIELHRRIAEFREAGANERRLVCSICIGVARNYRRGERRRLRAEAASDEARAAPGEDRQEENGPLAGRLGKVLAALTPNQRAAFDLYHVEEKGFDAIAALIGLSRNTVRARLAEAEEAIKMEFLPSPPANPENEP